MSCVFAVQSAASPDVVYLLVLERFTSPGLPRRGRECSQAQRGFPHGHGPHGWRRGRQVRTATRHWPLATGTTETVHRTVRTVRLARHACTGSPHHHITTSPDPCQPARACRAPCGVRRAACSGVPLREFGSRPAFPCVSLRLPALGRWAAGPLGYESLAPFAADGNSQQGFQVCVCRRARAHVPVRATCSCTRRRYSAIKVDKFKEGPPTEGDRDRGEQGSRGAGSRRGLALRCGPTAEGQGSALREAWPARSPATISLGAQRPTLPPLLVRRVRDLYIMRNVPENLNIVRACAPYGAAMRTASVIVPRCDRSSPSCRIASHADTRIL